MMRATIAWYCWRHGHSVEGEFDLCKGFVPHSSDGDDCEVTQVVVMEAEVA